MLRCHLPHLSSIITDLRVTFKPGTHVAFKLYATRRALSSWARSRKWTQYGTISIGEHRIHALSSRECAM
jgi:hypothetical protein